ncbi:MAG: hypothetical protein ACR2HS_07050, partial [Gammaproteobacteria bacterium]
MVNSFNNIKKKIRFYLKKLILYIFLILFGMYLVFILRPYYHMHFKPKAIIINVNGAPTIKG